MVCPGCSQLYKYLPEGKHCDSCGRLTANNASRPVDEWPLCNLCGSAYEFLKGTVCIPCEARERGDSLPLQSSTQANQAAEPASTANHLDPIHEAMSQSINPRTASSHSNPTVDVASSYDPTTDPRRPHATSMLNQLAINFGQVYEHAQSKANSSAIKIAKPKPAIPIFKSASVSKPIPKVHVAITQIENANNKKLRTVFNIQMVSYTDNTSWMEIVENLQFWLDGLYSKQFSHRIQSEDDFTHTFAESKATLSSPGFSLSNGTVGDLWKVSTEISGLHVSAKNIKVHKLELMAFINFPRKPEENDYEDQDQELYYSTRYLTRSGKAKRKAIEDVPSDDENIPPRKRRGDGATLASGGPGHYFTNLTGNATFLSNADRFIVKKLTVQFQNGGQIPEWVETEEQFTVWVHQKKFASGRTKEAFKMQFDSSFYAAKAFYDLGDFLSVPSPLKNLEYLKEEVLRLKTIGHALNEFNKQAKKEKISVYPMRVANSFLLEVVDGPKAGLAWLVDPFLDHEKMRKFSGSDIAGHNGDFAGQTCDAFAHWTLEDSGIEFVPSDIQGIVHTVMLKQHITGPECLTLFDLMSHSKDKTMGLGDKGITGIKEFCMQHQCNVICKRFGLGTTKELLHALEDDNDFNDLNIDDQRNNCSQEKNGDNYGDEVNGNVSEEEIDEEVINNEEAEGYENESDV